MGDGMGIWELRSAALLANESAISFPARPEWLLTHVNFHLYFWSNCESLLQQRNTVLDEVCDFSIACMADLLSENISTPGATTPSCRKKCASASMALSSDRKTEYCSPFAKNPYLVSGLPFCIYSR